MILSIQWSTEDVLTAAKDMGVKLTRKKADKILNQVINNHDANNGVTWGDFYKCIRGGKRCY